MPTISIFYGILIRMFFHDTDKHHVPHVHAEYQGQVDFVGWNRCAFPMLFCNGNIERALA
uniref:DUF4160 domain-containing protein n=1 Tax=Candidatus Kentrum sp. DK TaxID=2126562 RepID=A0A450S6I4_9GAMM|nr:MAG: protein of unknown function (DUF4160) [Candidatus Kentron sp. DK]